MNANEVIEVLLDTLIKEGKMPEIHIENWAQVIVHATQEGTDRITTHNIRTVPNVTDPTEANALAAAFWAQAGAYFLQSASNTVNFDWIEVRTLYPQPNNYQGVYFIGQPAPGAKASEAVPANVAAGVRWKTGIRGRKFHGRNNFFGITEGDTIGSTFTAAEVGHVVALAAAIMGFNGAAGITVDPVVASRVGGFLSEVFAFTVDMYVDSQRTRLRGRGD